MYVLILLVALLLPVQPSSKSEEPRIKHPHGNSNASDKANQKGDGQPQVTVTINQDSNSPAGHQDSGNKKQTDDDQAHERWYIAYVIATIIGSVAAISALIVLICQTRATTKAANAAQASADALTNIERPWLLVTEAKLIGNYGEMVNGQRVNRTAVYWKFKNFGKTPAFFDGVTGGIDLMSSFVPPTYKLPLGGAEDPVFPQDKESDSFLFTMRDITHEEWDKMKSNELFLAFFGKISYRDTLGGKNSVHYSKFCYRWVDGKFSFTFGPQEYNEYT